MPPAQPTDACPHLLSAGSDAAADIRGLVRDLAAIGAAEVMSNTCTTFLEIQNACE